MEPLDNFCIDLYTCFRLFLFAIILYRGVYLLRYTTLVQ